MPSRDEGTVDVRGPRIDAALVRRLLAAQHPRWAAAPLERWPSGGTDHALFRLGDRWCVRLPRVERAVAQVAKEQRWLPRLRPRLPLEIPVPVASGAPGEGYPWPWSIYEWIDGATPKAEVFGETPATAVALAGFVRALRSIDPADGPAAGPHNFFRGAPLGDRDDATVGALARLEGRIDTRAAAQVWRRACPSSPRMGPPAWIHGDLHIGNLLVRGRRLCAVIDFGGLGVGDPACDMMVAWSLFTSDARAVFREETGVDDATWTRGRGWALSVSVVALAAYWDSNPALAAVSRRTLEALGVTCRSRPS